MDTSKEAPEQPQEGGLNFVEQIIKEDLEAGKTADA